MNEEDPVVNLRQTAEIVSGIKQADQHMVVNGAPLKQSGTIKDAGLADGDVIMLDIKQTQPAPTQSNPFAQLNEDGSLVDPERLIQMLRDNPAALAQMRGSMPEQARAIEQGDVQQLQRIMRMAKLATQLPTDPMDPEYQRRMMEHIQQQQIDDNYASAMCVPFASVTAPNQARQVPRSYGSISRARAWYRLRLFTHMQGAQSRGVWCRRHALRGHGSQRGAAQGVCGLRCADDNHDADLRGQVQPHALG